MKINLLYGSGDILSGYLNIYPFALEETDEIKIGNVKNLDMLVDDGEATEIIATDVIDYISRIEVTQVIDNWIKKLRYGGELIMGGIDLFEVCKTFVQYNVDMESVNTLLHGVQNEPHLVKRVNLTITGLSSFLEDRGLKIIKKRHDGFYYIIEAHRKGVNE